MINEQIRDKEIRLIGENGEQLGIMSARDAMKMAKEAELDLVKIAPAAKPPVCKIIDYGKYRYEQARKEKEAKKKQKTIEVKEVRLSPNIDVNDLNTKIGASKKVPRERQQGKSYPAFPWTRDGSYAETASTSWTTSQRQLKDVASVDKPPKIEGRSMTMFLTEKR